jgi:hypothetical protein
MRLQGNDRPSSILNLVAGTTRASLTIARHAPHQSHRLATAWSRSAYMRRKLIDRIVTAVTEPLWQRDKLEMRSVNTLLAPITPKPVRRNRRPATKRQTRAKKRSA